MGIFGVSFGMGPRCGPACESRQSSRGVARLFVTDRTVEAHVKQIFLKLGLSAAPGSHRRVLAVLAYLRGAG